MSNFYDINNLPVYPNLDIQGSLQTSLNTPADVKTCNFYKKSLDKLVIETIPEYLSRVYKGIRVPGALVTVLLPKDGYTLQAEYSDSSLATEISNFDVRYYAFVDGIEDSDFIEVDLGKYVELRENAGWVEWKYVSDDDTTWQQLFEIPKGITWKGAWVTASAYVANDLISYNGSSYICVLGHTSGTSSEPETGASWETYWELAAQKGDPGIDGESAYELAVQEGFVGTLSEWLEFLEGSSAYDVAVEQGFTGTVQEWLDSLVGPPGPQGPTGNEGIIVTQASHGFSVEQAVKYNGTYSLAQADSAANAGVVGIVAEVIDVNTFRIVGDGYISGSWTPGTDYFLSPDVAGAIVSEPESWEVGEVRLCVGYGVPEGLKVEIDVGDEIVSDYGIGIPGEQGKSAYETWNEIYGPGTEEDFLAWLQEGSDGLSAYEIWLLLPPQTGSETEQDFIDSLKGDKGDGFASVSYDSETGKVTFTWDNGDAPVETGDLRGYTPQKDVDYFDGDDGVDSYTYVAYASDDQGSDFSLTPTDLLKYRAEIQVSVEKTPPVPADFSAATWVKYLGTDGEDGYTPVKDTDYFDGEDGNDGKDSFTYVAYASDSNGTGWSLIPTDALKYRAEIHTDTEIATPSASDFSGATWVKYLGTDGEDGVDHYTYVAFASSSSGTGWSLTPNVNLKYRAEIHSNTELTPVQSDFTGATWVKYLGTDGIDGEDHYTYIAYASDDQGTGFSLVPSDSLKYRAEIHTNTELTPLQSDFSAATWLKYLGDDGYTPQKGTDYNDGEDAFVYVAYATSNTGSGWSLTPTSDRKYRAEIHSNTQLTPVEADFSGATWVKYLGDDGVTPQKGTDYDDGIDAYVYVAYASDGTGSDWNTTPSDILKYRAEIHSTIPLTPIAADFNGATWVKYIGENGNDGYTPQKDTDYFDGTDAFVYVAYALDNTGTGFSLIPNDTLKYRAEIHSDTSLTPVAGDFSGATWVKYIGDTPQKDVDYFDGAPGADGKGWTGVSYNSLSGVLSFTSDDGLEYESEDIRATSVWKDGGDHIYTEFNKITVGGSAEPDTGYGFQVNKVSIFKYNSVFDADVFLTGSQSSGKAYRLTTLGTDTLSIGLTDNYPTFTAFTNILSLNATSGLTSYIGLKANVSLVIPGISTVGSANASLGSVYYNTTDNTFYGYNGSWVSLQNNDNDYLTGVTFNDGSKTVNFTFSDSGKNISDVSFDHTHDYDKYTSWFLKEFEDAGSFEVTKGQDVIFKGSGDTSVSRSGNTITISSSADSGWRGIHDTPQDGYTLISVSSNWAYNHENDPNAHGTYNPTIGTDIDLTTSGAQVISTINLTNGVVIENIGTRDLTPGDIGASAEGHLHDTRYYTQSQVNTYLSGKVGTNEGWNLYVDSVDKGAVTVSDVLNIEGGDDIGLGYSATNNTITINWTGTSSDTNHYLSALAFDTDSGILTATVIGENNPTVNLDGRYSLSGHTHSYHPLVSDGTDTDVNTSGSTIIDNIYVTNGIITSIGTRTLTLDDLGGDNYNGWDLYTNGTSRGRITSGENVNFETGGDISLNYSATNNTVTFSCDNTWRPITSNPLNGFTTTSISTDWAYDHVNSSTAHPRDERNQIAGDYHPLVSAGTDTDVNTSGATIIDNIYVTNGVVTSMGTRTLYASDLSAYTQYEVNSLVDNLSASDVGARADNWTPTLQNVTDAGNTTSQNIAINYRLLFTGLSYTGGIMTESSGKITEFGANFAQTGNYSTGNSGALVRVDTDATRKTASLMSVIYQATPGSGETTVFKVGSQGNVVADGNITAQGNLYAVNTILSGSDKRLKENIAKPNVAWTDEVDLVSFNMITCPGELRYGVIAQDLQKYSPSLVSENESTGMLSVNYIDFLVAKVARLEERIKELENN